MPDFQGSPSNPQLLTRDHSSGNSLRNILIKTKKLSGTVEIDESLFGRRVKHHRGDPNRGVKVTLNKCYLKGYVSRQNET